MPPTNGGNTSYDLPANLGGALTMSIRNLAISALPLLLSQTACALIINVPNTNQHERFANHPDFIGNPHDWSGVGRNAQFATLVSDTFFVGSIHRAPVVGTAINFYHSNDPSGTADTRTVAETWRIGTSDLLLGRLNQSVSASVKTYSIPDIQLNDIAGRAIHVFGLGSTGPADHGQKFGSNRIQVGVHDYANDNLSGTSDIFAYDYDRTAGANEATVGGGDSGAPTFLETANGPLLLGVHWFTYTDDTGTRGTGDTFIPSHVAQMNAIMSGFGEQVTVTAVPGPRAALPFLTLTGLAALYRRRIPVVHHHVH